MSDPESDPAPLDDPPAEPVGYWARRRARPSSTSSRIIGAIAIVVILVALVAVGQLVAAKSVRDALERTDSREVRSLLRDEECVHHDVKDWYVGPMQLEQPSSDPVFEEIRKGLNAFLDAPRWAFTIRREVAQAQQDPDRPPVSPSADRVAFDRGVIRVDYELLDRGEHSVELFTSDHSLYQAAGASFWITSCTESLMPPLAMLQSAVCLERSVDGDEVVIHGLLASRRVESDCAAARATRAGVAGDLELRIRDGELRSQRYGLDNGEIGDTTVKFEHPTTSIDVPPFWRIVPEWARNVVA